MSLEEIKQIICDREFTEEEKKLIEKERKKKPILSTLNDNINILYYLDKDYNNIYKDDKYRLLAVGEYRKRKFIIAYPGHHPCAYIKSNIDYYNLYQDGKIYDIPAHGGITFYNCISTDYYENITKDIIELIKGKFFGWDYGHIDDYEQYYETEFFKELSKNKVKHNIVEIIRNVNNTIDWLIEYEKQHHINSNN